MAARVALTKAATPDPGNPRKVLAGLLTAALPREWVILDHEEDLEANVGKVCVIVSQQRKQRHPAAPLGKLLVTFRLRLVAPSTDVRTREDALDDYVDELLFVIERLGTAFVWSEASKVLAGSFLAYDVDLTATANRPAPTTRKA